ncbi:hypothetical protein Hamer_G023542 [Homarus americanus]|uniref:Uncharacterized protein n=1 Tax=Homarus americanus TaxID=6706 RepID=A0A8J5K5V8_HOMAM|nr:hypothetical protein Hamer_G023542 [Homarus americanus]
MRQRSHLGVMATGTGRRPCHLCGGGRGHSLAQA